MCTTLVRCCNGLVSSLSPSLPPTPSSSLFETGSHWVALAGLVLAVRTSPKELTQIPLKVSPNVPEILAFWNLRQEDCLKTDISQTCWQRERILFINICKHSFLVFLTGDPISGVRCCCRHNWLFPVWLQHWSHQRS